MTDLHYAAYCQDLAAVKRCIEQGFDVNQEDDGGWPPILWAIDMAAAAPAKGVPELIVDYLLDHGARFELKNAKYKTILEFARDHDGYVEEHLIRRMKKEPNQSPEPTRPFGPSGCYEKKVVKREARAGG